MRMLRLSFIFSQIISIILVIILYFFSVAIFQTEKIYPKHVHKTLFLDRYLSEDEINFITYSALEWSESTQHIVEFDIVTLPNENAHITDNDIVIMSVSPDHPIIMFLDSNNKNYSTLGYYDDHMPIPVIYLVTDRITDQEYSTVVLHELGHALGLEHNEDINGIGTLMYPNISLGADHITLYDLRNFCKLYHCKITSKN